jgi:hypothetical protein
VTCDICGREKYFFNMPLEARLVACHREGNYTPFVRDCFRLGYEREKARADKAEALLKLAPHSDKCHMIVCRDPKCPTQPGCDCRRPI